MRKQIVLLLLLTVPWLLGCGGETQAEEEVQQVQQEEIVVAMNDMYFGETNDNSTNPPVWTVTSGVEIVVSLDNQGALEHNWAILKLGEQLDVPYDEATHKDLLLFEATKVQAKQSGQATFVAPEPGEYQVICTVPGHSMLMQGRLVVN